VIDLISPPRSRAKIEPDSKPHIPSRIIQPESGKTRRGAEFETLDEAIHAIYSHQEEAGHKWVFGQSYKTDAGVLTKRTLRCNRYRNATPTHHLDIDPSDYRQGKSAKTQCKAHVNVNRLPASTKWYLSLVDLQHNHEREIPIGGAASRLPTQEHRDVVARFLNLSHANIFPRFFARTCMITPSDARHICQVLHSHFPENTLEDRQISNMLNDARRQAREDVAHLGGDITSI
ncbi:hypothetical protein C8R44DRAFT_561981, partial [Mycena epipterygia]